jgi:hypothetical protein
MTRALIYFNLHRRCFSVKDLSTGLVIAHADTVVLRNVVTKVSEAGRQRVLREKRKNVHAGLVGEVVSLDKPAQVDVFSRRASYNPYKGATFFFTDDGSACVGGSEAILSVDSARRATIYVKEM